MQERENTVVSAQAEVFHIFNTVDVSVGTLFIIIRGSSSAKALLINVLGKSVALDPKIKRQYYNLEDKGS